MEQEGPSSKLPAAKKNLDKVNLNYYINQKCLINQNMKKPAEVGMRIPDVCEVRALGRG
jgi:hypothetical protein